MERWDIVLVIVVLIDLFISVYKPMSGNTKAMTELNITMKCLSEKIEKFDSRMADMDVKNHESYRRIWEHNEEQDEKLNNHETRLQVLEKEK